MKNIKQFKSFINESDEQSERNCVVEIITPFDSGFVEWVEDEKIFNHLGTCTTSQKVIGGIGRVEIITIECSNIHLKYIIDMCNSNIAGNLDCLVEMIKINYNI